jgi:hypothetical protein
VDGANLGRYSELIERPGMFASFTEFDCFFRFETIERLTVVAGNIYEKSDTSLSD